MPLDADFIDALLSDHDTQINQYGDYKPGRHEPPQQTGPLRFKRDRGPVKCLFVTPDSASGKLKGGMCKTPHATVEVKGVAYCTYHALVALNNLLVEQGVLE